MSENNRLREVLIPNNYHQGVNIGNKNIRLRNAVEGVIFSVITYLILSNIMTKYLYLDITEPWPLTILIAFVVIVLAVSIIGINDDPITIYLLHCLQTFKRKRVTYYNPRIKYEATFFMKNKASSFIEEDHRISILDKYKNQLLSKTRYKAQNELLEDSMSSEYYFEDDMNVESKPLEYMSEKEKKRLNKIERKNASKKWKEMIFNAIQRKEKPSKTLKGQ